MNLTARLRLARLGFVGLLWMPSGQVVGQEGPTAEELRKKLAVYATSPEALVLTKKQIGALESESYAKRRQAMASLIEATSLAELVADSQELLTKEGRTALKIVAEAQVETGAEDKLRFLMRQVQQEKVIGLTDAVLKAWEGRAITSSESTRLSREALKATVQAADLDRLKEGLQSATPFVRELSLIGLQKLLARKEDVAELLEPCLGDEHGTVRLEAAVLAASHQNRASLPTLAGLLDSEAFHLRNQSHEILTAITEQDFGYYSDGLLKDRQSASKLWQRWVAKFGEKAPLRFDEIRYWLQDDEDIFE